MIADARGTKAGGAVVANVGRDVAGTGVRRWAWRKIYGTGAEDARKGNEVEAHR